MFETDTDLLALAASFIPPLTASSHKGSSGRIAVIGGSVDYCGAPYFAAMSSLRAGIDYAFVFCPPAAAAHIKAFSPDIVVRPLLSPSELQECIAIVSRCHGVVIGPGIGSDPKLRELLPAIARAAIDHGVPLVVDTDVVCDDRYRRPLGSKTGSRGLGIDCNHTAFLQRKGQGL